MGILSPHCNPRQVCEASPGCGVTPSTRKGPHRTTDWAPRGREAAACVGFLSDGRDGALLQPPPGFLDDYEGRHIAICCSSSLFHTYIQYISWLRESPHHRMYLWFAFQGICYEYCTLPFSLSLSPRVFMRRTKAAIAPLRQQGIRLAVCGLDPHHGARTEGAGHTRVRQGVASLASPVFSDTGRAYE